LKAWLNADCPPLTDKAAKREKTAAYVNGLLEHGGPSTDVFVQALGLYGHTGQDVADGR